MGAAAAQEVLAWLDGAEVDEEPRWQVVAVADGGDPGRGSGLKVSRGGLIHTLDRAAKCAQNNKPRG